MVGPIFAMAFKAVAENGVWGVGRASGQFGFGDGREEMLNGRFGLVIDDVALRAEGGAFYFHSGMAGDEVGDLSRGVLCPEKCFAGI